MKSMYLCPLRAISSYYTSQNWPILKDVHPFILVPRSQMREMI